MTPADPCRCLVDGTPATGVPFDDRGLQYGDGLFETLAVRDGRPLLLEEHLQRLQLGMRRLAIPPIDPQLLRDEIAGLAQGQSRAVIKLIVTRGSSARGYAADPAAPARRLLSLNRNSDYPARHWQQGVRLHLCETRLGVNPRLAGIKHLNRLEQVLARAEWNDPEIAEGLLLDSDGFVIEGVFSNLFIWQPNRLLTPILDRCGVTGVMRQQVLRLAAANGMPVEETRLRLEDVISAPAVFITNSLIGAWPVRRIGDHAFDPIGCCSELLAELRRLAGHAGNVDPGGQA